MLDLNSAAFRDKVSGCWLGKNCGGTLGAPLERGFGAPEPFDVWWYPELKEGGIPNDDLEMQLIWLKALEEIGPHLKAADLAQYWLNHIGYNFDEYGLNKTNLRLGLQPPVSGYYNNWFRDCMGCPIRSEIWACVAPGVPRVAVRYAHEDAICDHAGGESVFGELFNTAIESAAFVVSDREQLLDIGLSYVPPGSQTAKAVNAVRDAYKEGVDWKTARKRVLAATPHYNAQYSPINMGLQVIGWLYGNDFGDAICKAVNCGYDTDCTGATLGSILGIIVGRSGLPEKWTQPLGEEIATNESWGGLLHVSDGTNPVPVNLTELTERVCVQAQRVLTAHGIMQEGSTFQIDPASLYADESIQELWNASPTRVTYQTGMLTIDVEYVDTPAVVPGESKVLQVYLNNPHLQPVHVECTLNVPSQWTGSIQPERVHIPAQTSRRVDLNVDVPLPTHVENTNLLMFSAQAEGRPAQLGVPIVLVGAYRFFHTQLYEVQGRTDKELFEHVFAPEQASETIPATLEGRGGDWTAFYARENDLPLQNMFTTGGVLYARTYLWNAGEEIDVWVGAAANCPVKMWLNSKLAVESFRYPLLRPNYAGSRECYATLKVQPGWNEVLFKFVRTEDAEPFACHFVLSDPHQHYAGITALGRTRAPWDK